MLCLSLTAAVTPADESIYINACCWGGDVIRDRLLPVVENVPHRETGQEDWGWYIWLFEENSLARGARLEINISCDDIERREFRIHLLARRRRYLFSSTSVTPALTDLYERVKANVELWADRVA
jgi:hypothetical protein